MKVSIALCTYNGGAYLQQQLDSILKQTHLPYELVVCDDGSTDNTYEILTCFQQQSPFTIKIIVNEKNMGSTMNFAQAIDNCSGDVIFLADQDDVWCPDKLAKIIEVFMNNSQVNMVFSDADVVDSELNAYSQSLWQCVGFDELIQQAVRSGDFWSKLFIKGFVTGATMAFRSSLREFLNPFPKDWVHDEWITFIADITGRVYFLPDKLIQYRIHGNQQIGVRFRKVHPLVRLRSVIFPDGHRKRCKRRIERIEMILGRVFALKVHLRSERIYDELLDQLEHWKARYYLSNIPWRKWAVITKEIQLGRYEKYSGSTRVAWKDFIEP